MYTLEERDAAHNHVLEIAASDRRVVSAAVVGSLALGGGDRWSDLDLTFAVDDDMAVADVLRDWTRRVVADLDALVLFDLPRGDTIYRVFLLPGCLQLDLSFTPASRFGAAGPRFRLLFGQAHPRPYAVPPPAQELFGWAVAYARDARACIERRLWWQAEHCISAIRDNALAMACRRRNLPTQFGRGFDDLPDEVLQAFEGALVRSLTRDALLEALTDSVQGLLRESAEAGELATRAEPRLRELLETEAD
jgi:predicted nucleotidyltransferase